jgi:hypothetical protein
LSFHKPNTMKIIGVLAVLVLSVMRVASFAVSRDFHSGHASTVCICKLRPGQAAELEACAYDLIREANANKEHGRSASSSCSRAGPMAWLSSRVFARTKNVPRAYFPQTAISSTSRLSNDQP